ncbi:alpha-amylase family glycosyl hydrolase [Rouxiella badensis]|nr:alpha-amylase family glycosyl hydrolase [Rouxiella badensis]
MIDYRRIDEHLGGWSDIHHLSANFNMMFDCVINHISRSSEWLKGYIKDDPYYHDYFIEANPETRLQPRCTSARFATADTFYQGRRHRALPVDHLQ